MFEAELKELDRLLEHYGTDITTRQALDALKEELKTQRERDPYWRFKQGHSFKTAWAEMWPGGNWISLRIGDSAAHIINRASMSEAELKELDELKEHYGTDITTRQALDALKEELKTQRERDPYWRLKSDHKFKTAWAEMWPGGSWIAGRVGVGARATRLRASMSEAELKELDELKEHYGRSRQ
jgi:hypothetical protein